MKTRKTSFLVLFLALVTLTGSASAATYLSVPSEVAEDENATFVVEESRVNQFYAEINVSGSGGTYFENTSTSDGVASVTVNLSDGGLTEGDYTVKVSVENESVNLSDTSSSSFSISSGISGALMMSLTSKEISTSECPLEKSESMNGECKLFGVNVTLDESSNLTQVSESGDPLTASINNGNTYVGLVDAEESGVYDTIFWDDDGTFREANETGESEKSFISAGEKIKEFSINNRTASLNVMVIGNDLVFGVPPTADEVPIREGDTVNYAFLGYKEADSILGLTVDAEPVEGRQLDVYATNLRNLNEKSLSPADPTTNSFGFTGIGEISSAEVGRHKVNIDNVSSQYYEVRSFDINYDVLDVSTGNRENTFQPGDSVEVKVVPTLGGEQINFNQITIDLIDSSGNKFTKTLESSTSAVFDLPENVSAGQATVTMNVEDSTGATQTASTSFEIKKFRVHTIPLRSSIEGRPRPADSFEPNSTGYAFVGAVKLGTFGGVQEIMGADFYDIDDPSTSKDECKQNVGDIKGELDGQEAVKVLNKTSMNRSSLFEGPMQIPEKMNTQCIVKFKVEEDVGGFFTGSISTERAESNETQSGQLTFGVSNFEMRGGSVNPGTGEHEWEFGVDQRVGIRPVITEIGTYQRISNSKIVDTSVLSLEGDRNAIAKNVTFNASGSNLLAFNAPDTAGNYRVNFLAEVNTSGSPSETQTVKGTAYFGVKVFEIEADITSPENSYQMPPKSNITAEVSVKTPSGQEKSGVKLDVVEIRNGEQETSYLDDAKINSGTTDANGTATIKLIPDNEWGEGWYNARIKGTDPQGNSDYGYLYFRVDKYDVTMNQEINGEPCRYCYNSLVSGDSVQFLPKVLETGGGENYGYAAQIGHDIVLERSSLTYYGNRRTYSSEDIPLEQHAEVIGADGNQTLNISTDNLSAGSYGLDLKLNLSNGDTTIADEYFRLSAFQLNVSTKQQQRSFQPGAKITYFLNTSTSGDYKVSAGTFRSYDYRTGERKEVEPSISQNSFQDTSSMALNLTVPDTSEGYYYGDLEITSGGTTQYENVDYEVKRLGVAMPKTAKLGYSDRKLQVENESYYEDATTSDSTDCSEVLASKNLEFKAGDITGESCSVVSSEWEDLNITWIDQPTKDSWNDSTVYVTEDSKFNESGDIAVNKTLYESFTLSSGLKLNITSIDQYEIKVAPLNGFSSEVIFERNADSYFYDNFYSKVEESDYNIEMDLNGDGDMKDEIRTLLVNNSGTFTTRLSFNNNFTTENSSVLSKTPIDLGAETVYGGDLRNTTGGWERNLVFASAADYSNLRVKKPQGTNYTFPVMVSYPNGTPVDGKQVGIARIVRQSDSKIFKSQATATTDSNGVAFINTDLPDLGNRASATYRVIPSTTVNGKQKTIDSYSAPVVEVRKFDRRSEKYARIDIGQMESYSNSNETVNTKNLIGNESVNLTGIRSSEYRFIGTDEVRGSSCYDLNFDRDCGETVSVLLYKGWESVQGMNVSRGLIDDDSIFGESYDSETEGDEESIGGSDIYPNISSVDFESYGYVDFPHQSFAVFNESTDELSLYRNQDEVYSNDSIYLALHFTELFSRNALSGEVTLDTVSYDGETYNSTKDFSKSLDSNGVALLNISRTDFTGSDTSWESGTLVSFGGTVSGTSYQQTVQIEGNEDSTSGSSSGGGGSGGTFE